MAGGEPTSVGDLLEVGADDAVAVYRPDGEITWAELRRIVAAAEDCLREAGVGLGSRVLCRVGDDFSRLIAGFAVLRLGGIHFAVNPATIGKELRHIVTRSEPVAVISDDDLAEAPAEFTDAPRIRNSGGRLEALGRCREASVPGRAAGEDPAMLIFTSGTSALPKLAVTPHRALVAMGRDLNRLLSVSEEDRFLALSPFFHVAGWCCSAMPAAAAGASLVMPGPFSASRFWRDVERWQPTIWNSGLAFIEMVAARGGPPPAKLPFRHVVSNLRPDTWRLGREQLGLPLGTYYGLTENCGRGTISLDITDYRAGFVGRVYGDEDAVRIADEQGRPCPPGQEGEIQLRGPGLMLGYFRDPEATAAAFQDGWLRTGDRGLIDEQGDLYYRGRFKNMIKRSGENIYAEEIELLLLEHEDVRDAIVIAVPDRVREEEVKAIVVPTEGVRLDPVDLHRWCAERVAAFKVPRYIELADSLPRTPSGKPDLGLIKRTRATPDGSWDAERELNATAPNKSRGGVKQ